MQQDEVKLQQDEVKLLQDDEDGEDDGLPSPPDAATWDDLYDPEASLQRRELSGLTEYSRWDDESGLPLIDDPSKDERVRYRPAWQLSVCAPLSAVLCELPRGALCDDGCLLARWYLCAVAL